MKDILKAMLIEFFIILSGTTIGAAIFCTVFYPDAPLGASLLWQLITLSFLTALPLLLFYSKNEFSKKQMRVRQAVHLILVVGLIIFLAYTWKWIEFGSYVELLAFVALVLLSYTGIALFMYQRDKKLAKALNEKLREFKDRKED